ncbi:Sphingosine N-acyltransferase LAG1 [Pleurostoma richardsiae]|uniref:Sphingosine N-acyltransferase LAG1 n=1 Tax=Pleurostoma richardsiae TaxID=41990 RepID=A0AA38RKD1_9PEZI|nr:Sphingosine N-acyltransferase LAG1 [Pleurostoma richardsiae]
MGTNDTYPLLSTSAAYAQATRDQGGSSRLPMKSDAQSRFSLFLRSLSMGRMHPSRPARRSRLSKRRKGSRGSLSRILRRTWTRPLLLMLVIIFLYAISPTESNIAGHFIFLSYKIDNAEGVPGSPPQYGKGLWDLAFVCFYTVFLTFTREFVMQELLRPLARACDIRSRGKQSRFMEQMYTACYVAFMGPLGLWTMRQTPGLWYFETRGMYESFPHRTHEAVFKFYYLFQAAFWVQQVVVMILGQEKRRRDFHELIAHHVITISLIGLSYRFHFTYMGIAVYVTHDLSDFLLALSKSLNYADNPLQAPIFTLCIFAWVYLRHYINLLILYSITTEFRSVGPFELNWETQQYKCWISQVITFGLLAALQVLNLYWLYALFRNAYRFAVLGIRKDDRSDPEESEVENEELKMTKNGEATGFNRWSKVRAAAAEAKDGIIA